MTPIKPILIKHTNSVKQGKSPVTSDFLSFSQAVKIAAFSLNSTSLLHDIRASVYDTFKHKNS